MKFTGVCKPYNLADACRLVGEIRVFIDEDMWVIPFVDPAHIVAGEIKVRKRYFRVYNLDEKLVVGLDCPRLHDMLKAFGRKEEVRITITKDKTVIQNIPEKGKGTLTYEMSNIDPEATRRPPDLSKVKEKVAGYNTIVYVPAELLRSERKKFRKTHGAYRTQLFLIGYTGESGVVSTRSAYGEEEPTTVQVEGKGEKGYVIVTDDVVDILVKDLPKRIKTISFMVNWGDVAHVMFAIDPEILVDAYVAPYALSGDELEEWLAEVGISGAPEAKPKAPETELEKEVRKYEEETLSKIKEIEEKYEALKEQASKTEDINELWETRNRLVELDHQCAAIIKNSGEMLKKVGMKKDLRGRVEKVIDECRNLKDKIDKAIDEAGKKYEEMRAKEVDISLIKIKVGDIGSKVSELLAEVEEEYKPITARYTNIISRFSTQPYEHYINELRNIKDELKALSDKISDMKGVVRKQITEINVLMEQYKDYEKIVSELYPLLSELEEYERELDKWTKRLDTDMRNVQTSIERMRSELEKAVKEKAEKKMEVEEAVKEYADEIKAAVEEFNKLKDQLETLKKMKVEMIDYKKVHEANLIGRMREIEKKLDEIYHRLREIYVKTGLVYADRLSSEVDMLVKTIRKYADENRGWLLDKVSKYVEDYLKAKGIKSKKIIDWLIRSATNYIAANKKLPDAADIERMLSEFIDSQRLIYTNEREFRNFIARDISRRVMKETKMTYYRYDPTQLDIEVNEFITVSSKPVYGVTYTYSYPRLSVKELKELNIEPNPDKWVTPPLGWKPKRRKPVSEEEVMERLNEMIKYLDKHYQPIVQELAEAARERGLTEKQKKLVMSLWSEYSKYLPREDYDNLMMMAFLLKRINLNRVDKENLNKLIDRAVKYGMTRVDRNKLLTYFYRYRKQLSDPKILSKIEAKNVMKLLPYVQKFTDEFPDLKLAIGQIKAGLKGVVEERKPEEMPYVYKSPRPLTSMAFPAFFRDLEERGVAYAVSDDGFVIGVEHPIPVKFVDELELKLIKTPEVMRLIEFADYFKVGRENAAKVIVEADRQDLLHDVSEAIKGTKTYNRFMVESSAEALRKEAEEFLKGLEQIKKVKVEIPPHLEEYREIIELAHEVLPAENGICIAVSKREGSQITIHTSDEKKAVEFARRINEEYNVYAKVYLCKNAKIVYGEFKRKPELPFTEKEIRIKVISEISKLESIHNVTVPEEVVDETVKQVTEKLAGVPKEKAADIIKEEVKRKVQAYLKEIKKPPEKVSPEKVEDIIAGELAIAAAKYDVQIPEDQRIEFTSKLLDRAVKLKTVDEVREFVSKEVNKWVREHAEQWKVKPKPSLEDVRKCVEGVINRLVAATASDIRKECNYPSEMIDEALDYLLDHGYRKVDDYYLSKRAPTEDQVLAELGSIEHIRLAFVASAAGKFKVPPKVIDIILGELIRKGMVSQVGSGASAKVRAIAVKKVAPPPAKPKAKPKPKVPPELRRELIMLTPVLARYEAMCRACSFNIRSSDIAMLVGALKKNIIRKDKLIATTRLLLSCRILPTNAQAAKRLLTDPEFTILASEIGILDEVNKKIEVVDTVIKLKEARVSTATLNAYAKILVSAIRSRTYVFDLNKLCILAQFTDLIDEEIKSELKEAIATIQPPKVKALEKRYQQLVNHDCFESLKAMLGI